MNEEKKARRAHLVEVVRVARIEIQSIDSAEAGERVRKIQEVGARVAARESAIRRQRARDANPPHFQERDA